MIRPILVKVRSERSERCPLISVDVHNSTERSVTDWEKGHGEFLVDIHHVLMFDLDPPDTNRKVVTQILVSYYDIHSYNRKIKTVFPCRFRSDCETMTMILNHCKLYVQGMSSYVFVFPGVSNDHYRGGETINNTLVRDSHP
jgi:hypothetical protein